MKRLLYLLALLLLTAAHARAQQTIVTATVVDPRGFAYQAGTGLASIQCPGNSMPYHNGSPLTRTITFPGLSGTGSFTQSLWDTSQITDVNNVAMSCQWRISITDACQVATFSVLVTGVTGAGPVNLSSQINAASVNLSPACTPPGTLNSVTIGGLPPLFNSFMVGTPVNPIFVFGLISQAPNLVFASPVGTSGPPSFRALVAADLPGGTGTVTNVTATSPITSTGGATPNIACPTCVTSVSGTANQITSSGGPTPTLSLPAAVIAPGSIAATTSLAGTSVTDSGLTNGRCVQAGVGGLLSTPVALPCNGGFTQVQAITFCPAGCTVTGTPCTTTGSSFDFCQQTLNWPVSWADTNYSVACNGVGPIDPTNSPNNSRAYLQVFSKSTGSVTVNTATLGSAAVHWAEIDCSGSHN